MHVCGKIVQGQKRCHFLRVKRLGIQPDTEIFLEICLICHGQIPEVRTDQLHRIGKNVAADLQHLRQICAVAEDVPEALFPCFVLVKNMLHQIEDPENIRIRLDHDHAAPVIERRQVPMLPEADEAHIFTQRRARRQMVGRADVDTIFLKRLRPVEIKLRAAQRQLHTARAVQLDGLQLLLQSPIENIRAQLHGSFLQSFS